MVSNPAEGNAENEPGSRSEAMSSTSTAWSITLAGSARPDRLRLRSVALGAFRRTEGGPTGWSAGPALRRLQCCTGGWGATRDCRAGGVVIRLEAHRGGQDVCTSPCQELEDPLKTPAGALGPPGLQARQPSQHGGLLGKAAPTNKDAASTEKGTRKTRIHRVSWIP